MKAFIIDPHPLFMDALERSISVLQEASTIYKFTNTLDAIKAIESQTPPDLIFINIDMPKLDGLSFLKVINKRHIYSPVVMLCDLTDCSQMGELLNADIAGFIPKSHKHSQILIALNKIFDGETYIPETIELRLSRLKEQDFAQTQLDSSINALGVTRRQREVLKLAALGHANKAIGLLLNITDHTVKSHMSAMFQLLHAKSRAECIQRAYQTGLIRPPHTSEII